VGGKTYTHSFPASTDPLKLKEQIDWMIVHYKDVVVDVGESYGCPYFNIEGEFTRHNK